MLELRGHGTLRATGNKTLTGLAAVFNSETNLGTFSEVIRPGAFAKSLATGSNIRALSNHDAHALLGTTRGGTLQLRETAQGLAFELALPDTSHGRDLAILVDRGDIQGCSFGFTVPPGGDRWEERGTTMVRELLNIDLAEITLTADPAYADTSVAMRSKPKTIKVHSDANFLWLELS